MLHRAIDLLHLAKQSDIEILLNEEQLQLKLPRNKRISEGLLKDIKDNKQLLIDFLTTHKKANKNYNKLVKFDRSALGRIPLSFSQERLLFIDRLEGSVQYHIPTVLRLKGKLNQAALEYALQTIVTRHEILRTVILEEEGNAYQHVKEPHGWEFSIIDGNNYKENGKGLQQYIEKIISVPFDLSRDFMLRATLINLSEQEHVLVIIMHHIASDGWSISVLVKEVVELYTSYEEDRPMLLPPLKVQYADYAIWQRKYLEGEMLKGMMEYWKKKLSGVQPLELPSDFARPAVQSMQGATISFRIDKEIALQLQQLNQQQGTTMFMTLLAIFKVLLFKHSGQKDICVGTPSANRTQEELEAMIGFFINTLALRTEVSSEVSFLELLQQVKTTTLEAYANQDAPFEKIVEAIVRERDMSRSPLFQVMFMLQNTPNAPKVNLGELQLSNEAFAQDTTKYDLMFGLTETSSGFQGTLQYSTALYKEDTIQRMIGHFKELIHSVVREPGQQVGDLSIITEIERQQLLSFNKSEEEDKKYKTIIELFEEQVLKSPDSIALVFEDARLTYTELNGRANQLAHYLRERGVKRQELVPICIGRSLEMIVGILAILKAGGAYVPIDPEYPAERTGYMLEDINASIVLGSEATRLRIQTAKTIEIIELDVDWSVISNQSIDNPGIVSAPDHLAYVIYTSGSTGRPKGVLIEQKSVVSLVKDASYVSLSKDDILLSTGSSSFDATTFEYWSMLLNGGKLVLCSENKLLDNTLLKKEISENHITKMWFTSSWFNQLVEADISIFKGLDAILVGGEKLSEPHIKRVKETYSSIDIINGYGPTENTTFSLTCNITADDLSGTIPIGRPLKDRTAYILDEKRRMVPVGIIGEICLGGSGLARGYLNRTELTAEKFIDHPFSKKQGERLYKTGDLGRWLPDGNIEYLGRLDEQVKIRGYRIELGEIETVLMQSGLLSQAVVLSKEDNLGQKRLVGYLVPANELFDKQAISSYLHGKLPDYMVPALWVELKNLPLTANGKIDKRALPNPDVNELLAHEYTAPRNDMEATLAEIWQQLLGIERIGVHDNFFEVGGHSLLAMRVVSSIRRVMELEVAIKELFVHPTIGELATYLQGQDKGSLLPPIEVIQPRPGQVPLSFSQERLWFIDRLEGSVQYHLPSILRMKGKLNKDGLANALQVIVNRHEVLRTVIREHEGQALQYIIDQDKWQLSIVDGSIYKEDPQALRLYIHQLIIQPFDLSRDYMIRATLIKVDEEDHVLVAIMHHISSDAWSTSILVKEVVELYSSYEEGRQSTLAPVPLQYADYAIWQRNYLRGEILDKKINYWKDKLSGTSSLQMATDYPRPAVQSMRGAIRGFWIDKELSGKLRQLSQQSGTTLFMTMLAAFKVLLYRYSAQQDICVGTSIASRQQNEVEELIGFFVNTLVLRTEVSGDLSFKELLQNVKSTTLDAYANQEVPFEKIVETVVKERNVSRNPLFQVFFVLQNTPEVPTLKLGQVQLSGEGYELTTTQFDLMFNIRDSSLGLQGSIQYSTDLYNETTINRMIAHFQELLQSIVQTPEQTIGALRILPPEEEHELLTGFNNTKLEIPKYRDIIDLFSEQVAKTPSAVALVFEDQELTYQQLNERSGQLAHFLSSKGVKKETRVPIYIERGIDMLVGILGILKSGGAYVPIDPAYPQERISYILEDTEATIVISNSLNSSKLNTASLEVVELDTTWDMISKYPSGSLPGNITSAQLAYIIYTSGSTGKPKGVMIEHHSLMHYLLNSKASYINKEQHGSGSFIHLSYTFDASLTGMFMPLLFGRKVVIASKQFIDVFEDSNLHKYAPYDFIKITPTHLELLQNKLNISNGKLLTDRLVIGGEALKPGHFAYMIQQGIDVEIINEYGPTEATVGCSTYCFRTIGDQERIKNGILIGKPIDNIQLYILRENFALAPIGVRGEICIAGDGLARGYLNRAELTEEKFVTNPFSEEEGSKMYRTGDLGRWLPDGNMEYLGRIDDQVKIRGYRIELGEIESVLMQSESIKQAVVLAKEDKSGNQRLVGYIVTAEDFDNNAIISYLQGRLPDYMVPTLWIKLESLPVTPNGKVDKKALPDPDTSGISINEYAVPRNEVENKLTDIWKQLLDIDQVGIYNDFFELGGHSLLAIRVISAIRKQFEIELKINDVFEYPTIAQLAGYLQSHSSKNVHHAIERVEPQPENIPLSFSQERLWFIDQLEGSTQYHLPTVLRLQGKVNIEALEYAIQNVINRHDILRTVIMDLDGKPYQHIQDKDHWKISRIDGLIFKNDAATLQQFTQKIIQQPFDLSKDSMVRGALITIDELNHVLVITMHHIVSDGWSLSIIVKEVAEAYNAYEEGRPLNLPELQIQYADYAIWQRQHLHGENWDKKIAYWKEQLTGVTPLQLQTDYERPSIQSARGAVIPFRIEKEALDQMQLLSQQNGTTLFMTLLAAFKILLYRYSGQLDICVGTPIANRPQQELEELIGFFVNTLALRTEISRSASFLDLLQHVKSTTMGAFANQDVPFETVVNEVVRERDMSRSPLFQVTFSLQNTPEVPALRLGEIHLRGEAITLNSTKFDLSFNLTENIHGLQGSVIYCIDLYTASTVEQMIRHFKELIYSILRNPAEHISSLSMLGPADQYELLVGLNNAASAEAGGHSIVDLFEIQVLKTPEAIALVYEGENLSYYELNERANQLAHYLRSKGVGHETLVPICIERGISMLTGILGILKAGGAYVPINPDYPSERISYILSDIGATIIISSRISRTKVPKEHNIIVVEDDQALISSQATVNLQVAGSGNQLAYVIYTSGSTGKPKGVMVEHNSITSLIATQSRYFNITPDDRILQFADYTFDASVEQIFLTLLNGATLVMFSEGLQMDMELFEAFIKDNRVSHLHATPLFLENLPVGDYPSLKRIIAGGDVCKPILSNRWKSKLDFYNEYGPTETTVTAIEYRVGDKDQKHNAVPIGRPLPNTVVYLLDEFQGLVPLGATGEIYIGGVQVARGYVNRPDLTAERFIKDPFSTVPGARMYKTGDLGRWLPDGNIEYLGRMDEQVKIRGFRIELGEIESVLLQSGLADKVVVLARQDKQGNKRLVGYVVAEGAFDAAGIITYLQAKLPDYMVPAIWVELEALPLTSNGKIDRKALPEPDVTGQLAGQYVAPRNEAEKGLADIWEKLLGIEHVGINDNFFELGGDSILTIQVVSRARRLGYELQPRDIFIHQTIGKLSHAIAERAGSLVTGEQEVLTGLSGLLPIQQLYLETEHTDVNHFNQGVLLGINKTVTESQLAKAVEQLLSYHDALRFKYAHGENGWQQEYGSHEGGLITEDLSTAPKETLRGLIGEHSNKYQRSLDIKKGELIRVVWMQTPDTEKDNRLLIVIHHLAIDGVSWRILVEDLELLLAGGADTDLGPKSSSYRQWYDALEAYGKTRRAQAQNSYWQQPVKHYTPLPSDKEYTGAIRVKDMAQYSLRLGSTQTQSLLQEVPKVYHTQINDILLAALARTLSNWSSNENVVIGLEGHGREAIAEGIDTSRTVGWFTTLYPVLIKTPTVTNGTDELIKSVKEQLWAIPEKGIGYGVLKYINKEASLQGKDPWDIIFNYLGQTDNVVRESNWFTGAGESAGAARSNELEVQEKLSVTSVVQGGELVLNWGYSNLHYERATIEQLAKDYALNLQNIIDHCIAQQQLDQTVYTPSDYGLAAEVSYQELDIFLAEPFKNKSRKDWIESIYRLSGLQQGMLFHSLYAGGEVAYMEQFGCDLVGMDMDVIGKSWEKVLKHHTILRSAFYYDAFSIPVQCVYRDIDMPLEMLDYRAKNKEDQARAAQQYREADRAKGFDFKTPPLMRLALIRLEEDRYHMLWTSHHILFDGWSMPILMEEFLTTYETIVAGKNPAKVEEDRYEDYIRYIERADKEEEETYWRNYVKGIEQSTLLPFIANTTERTKGQGEYKSEHLQIDAERTGKIKAFAQKHRLTVNTVMQGVWSCLLHNYTGSKDVVYGVIVSGRPDDLPGVEKAVGMYINTLPLRSNLQGEKGIVEWLQGLQDEQVSSRGYQYTPLQQVQEWTGIQGDLFDSLLVFENYPVSKVISEKQFGFRVENVKVHEQTNYPLTIQIGSSEEIGVSFNYNSSVLKEEYVKLIRNHFEHVLIQFTGNPQTSFNNLKIITQAEEQDLLNNFNNTETVYPVEGNIVGIFEEQATKTPAAIALVFEQEQLTYQELNERSNQLAHYLKDKGVRDEMLIPLCVERSVEMIVGILGILKAGGVYVPIDPEYPQERASFMLEDAAAFIALSSRQSGEKLNAAKGIDIIELDTEWEIIGKYPVNNLQNNFLPNHLAYVIYTSGSTGNPKGVMIEHRGAVSLVKGVDYVSLSKEDILLSTGSSSFDATTFEYWAMLLNGGKLILCKEEKLLESSLLKEEINRNGVSKMWFTSSWFNQLIETDVTIFENLKTILVGGEKLSETHIKKLKQTYPSIDLINGYGPTENTTFSLTYKITNIPLNGPIPIGRPLSNRIAYILSEKQQLVPIGVVGEICIGGAGLARGYLNRPELTKEKFIANPISKQDGSRLYRTGDLGRWLPDGNIEYLGRMDDQVKIRGYRIEPGEIESVLLQSGLVSQAVVLAKEGDNGNKYLVGYVVMSEGAFDKAAVTSWLHSRLPDYMIPAFWVEMQMLPLTSNGKVNRKALPDFDASGLTINKYVAPRYKVEKILVEIWEKLLGVERVGIYDNFFELGGHSLLAMRLVAATRKELAVELAIKDLFINPTIAALAEHLQGERTSILLPSVEVIEIRPEHIPLSFSQERLWFIDRLEGSIQYHVPVVLRLKGILNKNAINDALKNVVNRHEVLRTVMKEQEWKTWQYVMDENLWHLEFFDGSLHKEEPKALQHSIQKLINKPFDLSSDHMLRATLVTLSEEDHVLVAVMHHIASDGWSMSILVREVMEFYSAYEEERPAQLKPLQVQYADYAIWQRQYLEGEILDRKITYWKDKLRGISPLQLHTDYARPLVQSTKGAVAGFGVNAELSAQLHELSQQQGTTMFMTLLAAFQVLLYRYSGQEDICVGTPIANRGQQELEELVGFFVNTIALRTEVNGNKSFTGLLQQVKATTLEAYANQDVPFEKVVDAVVRERDMSRTPLFQVMFILQNTPDVPAFRLGEVQLSSEGYQHTTSKFEITFNITDTKTGLQCTVEYCTDLYSERTIARFISHFKELLNAIVKEPEQKIGNLSVLSKVDEQLLVEFNNTKAVYPTGKTIIDLFAEQVLKTPNEIALKYEEDQLTYQELNEGSNQMANYLKAKGVEKETLVPLCVERSMNMIIAMLGILKAGGAYVPIDPEYPQERISYMLEDTAAKILISSIASRSKLQTTTGIDIIELDTEWVAISKEDKGNLQTTINPDQLAYVIYTSGSTGKPKGVMIEHSNLYAFLNWSKEEFALSNFEIVYATTSMCFDLSIFEIFYPLSIGKPVRIIENGLHISKWLPQDKQVLTNSVPVVMEHLLKEGTDISNISVINMAGEPIPFHVQQGLDTDRIEVRNLYGPTEDTTYSTVYRIKKDEPILIGKPISNTQVYIISKEDKLVPIGVAGEICIAGDGLARGYLNRKELTNEKFVPNPFTSIQHPVSSIQHQVSRMYRTGDLGRWLPDGNIEYLGRKDDQVKIRGYRIELGEIETVLMQNESISQAVILARTDNQEHKRLVGYIVKAETAKEFNKQAISQYLQGKLPDFMIPQLWVELEAMPLTPNGKIDKKALPDPEASELLTNEYVAPRNELETKLAIIWQELLNVERVGIYDNFFELGGHSMLAMRVLYAIKRELEIELTMKDLFLNPSITELLRYFQKRNNILLNNTSNFKSLVQIKAGGSNNIPLYIVCGAGGTAFKFKEFVSMLDAGQSVFGLQQPTGIQDAKDFPANMEEIAARYVDEITMQNPVGPYALSGHCLGGIIAFEMSKQMEAKGKKVMLLAMFDTHIKDITPRAKLPAGSFRNFYHIPLIAKKSFSKLRLKVNFETHLLRNYTKHAIGYKINKLKFLISRAYRRRPDEGFELFKELERNLVNASRNYQISPYNRDILVFYAKEHYYFWDKDKDVKYKKLYLNMHTKNMWKKYVRSVTMYEIDGDHSTIFYPDNAQEFAQLLQKHLNSCSDKKDLPEAIILSA